MPPAVAYRRLGRDRAEPGAVGLVVQAAYHLDEFLPLRNALGDLGIGADILVPIPPTKALNRFRPGVRRFRELLATTDLPLGEVFEETDLAERLSSVVVLNDWGVPGPLVASLRAAGRPTFAWVEGVQDFHDVDTGQERRAYRHVDHVFCLGSYGAAQLPEMERTVVGSERLRRLWARPPVEPTRPRVVVNSNFTYGVQTEHRRGWVRSVTGACSDAQIAWVLSRHTAERGTSWPHRRSRLDIGDLLDDSSHLVGRFSTVCYEALVRGVELTYHNPHGEREPTFGDARGAFQHTDSRASLAHRLRVPARSRAQVRDGAEDFLRHHLRLDDGPSPAALAAAVISDAFRS